MNQNLKRVILQLGIIFCSLSLNAQYSANPTIGIYSSSSINYASCTSSPGTIQAKVNSISGSTVNFQISRLNGSTFLSSGATYIRSNSPCGTILGSSSYSTGTYSCNLSATFNLSVGYSITVIAVTVSTSGGTCHSGTFLITNNGGGSFSITPSSLNYTANGGTQYVSVSTSSSWNLISKPSWISMSSSGYSGTFGVTAISNGGSLRTGSITLNSNGVNKTISISQASAVGITVAPTNLNFSNSGGTQSIYISCTGTSANLTVSSYFFTLSSNYVYANTNSYINVTCPINTGSPKNGIITISGGGITKTVYVTQAITAICPSNSQWWTQVNSAIMNPTFCGQPLSVKGCVVTDLAMLLQDDISNSIYATPSTLNTWLNNNWGYSGCDVLWDVADEFDGPGGLQYVGSDNNMNNWSWLDGELNSCRKVIINVNNNSHWVLCYAKNGPSGVGTSYKCYDPGTSLQANAVKTLHNFSDIYTKGRSFSGTWATSFPFREEFQNFDAISFENKIYPNPVEANSEIKYEIGSDQDQSVVIRIIDLNGRTVFENSRAFNEDLNLGSLISPINPGLYFVIFNFENGSIVTNKLIVSK